MDAEVKAKWVAALRSGKYKQGKGSLASRSRSLHCCLGVLCEVAEHIYESRDIFLPVDLGVSHEQQVDLSNRNDGAFPLPSAQSFAEIADYIEKEL